MNRIRSLIHFIKKGEFRFMFHGISKRLSSEILAIGLKKDLNEDFQKPNAKIELQTRLAKKSDHLYFKDEMFNYGLVEKDIKNCYVATDVNDLPCFRVWLMGFSENKKIKKFFTGSFPKLQPDEALIEGAFMVPSFRGKRIMPAALAEISEKGKAIGAQYVLAFVHIDHIPSLKSTRHAGFHPYALRREKWFLFKKWVRFEALPKDVLEKYYADTSS